MWAGPRGRQDRKVRRVRQDLSVQRDPLVRLDLKERTESQAWRDRKVPLAQLVPPVLQVKQGQQVHRAPRAR